MGESKIKTECLIIVFFFIPIFLWNIVAHHMSKKVVRVVQLCVIVMSAILSFCSSHDFELLTFGYSVGIAITLVIVPYSGHSGRPTSTFCKRREKISWIDDLIFYFFYTVTYIRMVTPLLIKYSLFGYFVLQ